MNINKEELFKKYPQSELDKKTESMRLRVSFDVICDSSPYVQTKESIMARVAEYVNDCINAMDESMTHWGDHTHTIRPMSITINEEGKPDYDDQELSGMLEEFYDPRLGKYDIERIEKC